MKSNQGSTVMSSSLNGYWNPIPLNLNSGQVHMSRKLSRRNRCQWLGYKLESKKPSRHILFFSARP